MRHSHCMHYALGLYDYFSYQLCFIVFIFCTYRSRTYRRLCGLMPSVGPCMVASPAQYYFLTIAGSGIFRQGATSLNIIWCCNIFPLSIQ